MVTNSLIQPMCQNNIIIIYVCWLFVCTEHCAGIVRLGNSGVPTVARMWNVHGRPWYVATSLLQVPVQSGRRQNQAARCAHVPDHCATLVPATCENGHRPRQPLQQSIRSPVSNRQALTTVSTTAHLKAFYLGQPGRAGARKKNKCVGLMKVCIIQHRTRCQNQSEWICMVHNR